MSIRPPALSGGSSITGVVSVVLVCILALTYSQSCADANVRCVGPSLEHETILAAYGNCTESSTPCVIMVKGGDYFDEFEFAKSGSTDSANPGQLIPFPGENVRWLRSSILRFLGDNWKIWDGGQGGTLELQSIGGTGDDLVELNSVENIQFGPGVTLSCTVGVSVEAAIYVMTGCDGIVVDGVTILSIPPGTDGCFSHGLRALFFSSPTPAYGAYRFQVRNSNFSGFRLSGVYLQGTTDALIDSNYFVSSGSWTATFVNLHGSSSIDVQNNIFDATSTGHDSLVRLYCSSASSRQLRVRHNDFICAFLPARGTVYLDGLTGKLWQVNLTNNLFSGDCGSDTQAIVTQDETDCRDGCLNDTFSFAKCNRATSLTIVPETSAWQVDNSCAGAGSNVSIDFHETTPRPFPYFLPLHFYAGAVTSPPPVAFDMRNISRPTIPSIGALRYPGVVCFGVVNSSAAVCSGRGDCVDFDTCNCTDPDYWGSNCHLYACFGTPHSSLDVCSSHGSCVEHDVCDCDTGYEEGTQCDQFLCFGVPPNPLVCSGHGSCVAFDDCDCLSEAYSGSDCADWECWDVSNHNRSVCSFQGDCVDANVCSCRGSYEGIYCNIPPNIGLTIGLSVAIPLCLLAVCLAFVAVAMISIFCFWRRRKAKLADFVTSIELQVSEGHCLTLEVDSSLQAWFGIQPEDVKVGEFIGRGGSGAVVVKAEWNGQTVAMKSIVLTQAMTQSNLDSFLVEIALMTRLHHPNIIQLYGGIIKMPTLGILMELCQGTVKSFLLQFRNENEVDCVLSTRLRFLREIAAGMTYLHSEGVIHRDLKPENVLISASETCKLMDFGLSRKIKRLDEASLTKGIGTPIYIAPEMLSGEEYTEKIDVYSFGITLWTIACVDFFPFGSQIEYVEFKAANDPTFRPNVDRLREVSPLLVPLATACWSHDPMFRPDFTQVASSLAKIAENLPDRTLSTKAQDVLSKAIEEN